MYKTVELMKLKHTSANLMNSDSCETHFQIATIFLDLRNKQTAFSNLKVLHISEFHSSLIQRVDKREMSLAKS